MVGLYRKTCEPKIGDENDQQWQSVTVPKKCNTGQNKDPKREQQHQRHQRRNLFSGDDAICDNDNKGVGGRTNVALFILPVGWIVRLDVGGDWAQISFLLPEPDRKSTRLNSSHRTISYAVF